MTVLAEGDRAPDFDLATDGNGHVRLSALKGRPVVVYFYPSDDTETCTAEAIDFSAAADDFAGRNAVVIGISPDDARSHDRFKSKHRLTVTLASDPGHAVADRYGVWVEKTLFGRKYMGVERATFLISADGTIGRIWRKVRIRGHVASVLASLGAT
jgi:peroxiredoxin Q/BCP